MSRSGPVPRSALPVAANGKGQEAPENQRSKRREQQRAIDTRLTIIRAALAEFAEKGFDGASMRTIADRAEMQHPLITYHFRTKDALWKAVAEHVWSAMAAQWEASVPEGASLSPRDKIREEIRQLYRLTIDYPDFHHFNLRENRPNNPRLVWLAETFQRPLYERITAQIRAAQEAGDLPQSDPTLVNYLLVGMASALSSLSAEIKILSGLDATSQKVVDDYWALIERVIFPMPSIDDAAIFMTRRPGAKVRRIRPRRAPFSSR